MKIAFVSDLHAAVQLPMARKNDSGTCSDRLTDVLSIFTQVREEDVDLIVVAGDLFDAKTPDGPTLVHTSRVLRETAEIVPVWLLPGNHDAIDRTGRMYSLQQYAELRIPDLRVLTHETVELDTGLLLHAVPWLPEERALKRIRERGRSQDPDGFNLLVCHQSFLGALWDSGFPSTEGLDPKVIDSEFHWNAVISGHLHRPQTFGVTGMYLGSPLDLRFGDEVVKERGFTIFEIEGSSIHHAPVQTIYPRFQTVSWDLDDGVFQEDIAPDTSYLRMSVIGSKTQIEKERAQLENLREMFAADCRCVKLEFEVRRELDEVRRLDVQPSMSGAEMVRRYAERFGDPDQVPLLTEVGSRFLDQ
jgi:DNA repair exonuclease SbcCD nuclease subunit